MNRRQERDLHHLQALAQLNAASMTPQAICQAALGLPMPGWPKWKNFSRANDSEGLDIPFP